MRKLFLLICSVLMACAQSVYAQSECVVTHYDEFSGMAQWWTTQIVQDRQGMIWFATWNGLNRYDGYQFASFKSYVGDGIDIPSDRIMDMLLDQNGNLLCQIDGRVFLFDVKTCKYRTVNPALERHMTVLFNKRHQQELAAAGKPITIKDRYGKVWHIPDDVGIEKDVKYCLTDSEGNVWLCSKYGAYRLSFVKKSYTLFDQDKPGQIRCFFIDKKNRYWVANRDDSTIRIYGADNRLLGYLTADGRLSPTYAVFGASVYHIMQDSHATIWLCSKPNGLFRLKEKTTDNFSVEHFVHHADDPHSLSDDRLYYAAEDQLGRLWIATFGGGLNCVVNPQSEQPQFLHHRNGLSYPMQKAARCRQIYITDKGVMLVATTGGLLVANVSTKQAEAIAFKVHEREAHRANSLSNNATMYVTEDTRHRLYVCTESGGLNQITSSNLLSDQLEFRHYNMTNGLPSDVALSAVAMGKELLIVSNNQLILLNPDAEPSINNTAFFLKDKLRFSDAQPTKLPDGRWIFGLQNGAFTVVRNNLVKSRHKPNLVLTGISVQNGANNQAVCWQDTLVLQPTGRNVTVHFAALSYSGNDNISYAFRLGDGHEPWNRIGKNRSATFLDLKPGKYLLQICSTNNDGIWMDNIRTLTIIVKPTFWETRWAQLLYAVLTVMVVWLVFYTRHYITTLKRKQQELHNAYLALLNKEEAPKANTHNAPVEKPKMSPADEAFMQRVMRFIEEHIGDSDINIGDMAEATLTSRSGLNRKMKSLVGVTPLDFIREARIRKACQMLKDGASVNEAAYDCGFSDPKYFGKCFKADTGMTPTEYKNQQRHE